MRIAVCDDLPEERARLIPMLGEYLACKGISVEFVEYGSGEALLSGSSAGAFDLVFLDIYMGRMSGVDTARRLKAVAPDCVVIFFTTSREHGADAFDIDAFHYLVKPFGKEKLFSVMDKWYDRLCEIKVVTLTQGRTKRKLLLRDILYIDVLGRSSTVHTFSETFETPTPLSAIEAMLPSDEFIRPIRYCLAALRHIRSVGEDTLLLSNGEKIPISRRERDNLRERLAAYRLRRLRERRGGGDVMPSAGR